jgi:hypothetical protein
VPLQEICNKHDRHKSFLVFGSVSRVQTSWLAALGVTQMLMLSGRDARNFALGTNLKEVYAVVAYLPHVPGCVHGHLVCS